MVRSRNRVTGVIALAVCMLIAAVASSCVRPGDTSSRPPVTNPTAPPSPNGPRPTIVLVHGAFADTSSWDGEVSMLRHEGYDARAIANPLRNLTTDAQSVRTFLESLNGPIVLVGHSYGGAVISSAAAGSLNVKALVYVDAAAPEVGETMGSLSGTDSVLRQKPQNELFDSVPDGSGPPGSSNLYLKKDVFVKNFANDLPTEVATRLWASQRTASTSAFDTPSTAAAWKSIPSWFFISSGDQAITATSESVMATRAHSHVTTFQGGSHLTLISHPDAVTEVIKSAIASVH
jgi:pimeloyl-ACP methyl ester carboxylesterase